MTQADLEAIRNEKEAAAKARQSSLTYILGLAQHAIPAVLRAAEAGNVTCIEAVREMNKIQRP
jgi:hypothetical protein